ncbi:MAG TPA: hypothetical protein VL985_11560, partial [Stellaceae bacterium]|nr:hypothetical protein [Stellaceae bacterium]
HPGIAVGLRSSATLVEQRRALKLVRHGPNKTFASAMIIAVEVSRPRLRHPASVGLPCRFCDRDPLLIMASPA